MTMFLIRCSTRYLARVLAFCTVCGRGLPFCVCNGRKR